jgi:hypothetical protein
MTDTVFAFEERVSLESQSKNRAQNLWRHVISVEHWAKDLQPEPGQNSEADAHADKRELHHCKSNAPRRSGVSHWAQADANSRRANGVQEKAGTCERALRFSGAGELGTVSALSR